MKLYELSTIYKEIQDLDGEEISEALTNIEGLIEEKVGNIGKLIFSIQYEAKAYDDEISRLTEKKRIAQNKIKRLKEYLQMNMEAAGIDKIKSDIVSVSLRNGPPSVEVVDENRIPESYWRIKKEVDKVAVLEIFKDENIVIPGVKIVSKKFVSIK